MYIFRWLNKSPSLRASSSPTKDNQLNPFDQVTRATTTPTSSRINKNPIRSSTVERPSQSTIIYPSPTTDSSLTELLTRQVIDSYTPTFEPGSPPAPDVPFDGGSGFGDGGGGCSF